MAAPQRSTTKQQQPRGEAPTAGSATAGGPGHQGQASRAEQLAALAQELQGQAGELRADLEQAVAALEAAAARLGELAQAPTQQAPASGAAPEPRAYAGSGSRTPARAARRPERPKSAKAKAKDEAMLVATRMAVAGMDRKQIASALRKELGVRDADPILDRVLGAGR